MHDQHGRQQKPEASQHKHGVPQVDEEVSVELFDLVGDEVKPGSLEETTQTKQLLDFIGRRKEEEGMVVISC